MTNSIVMHMVEGELRIHDIELAKRFGFSQPRDIRALIARHRAAFPDGPIARGRGGGRQRTEGQKRAT
jgi:hypothetical protein